MRITNSMMTNRMILNLNKNARITDKLYLQLSTGKKIQYASEDPILAARSLKFRKTVEDTIQYQKNTDQGLSWMEVTETAFKNLDDITIRIRELAVQGASDVYSYEDRKRIATEISSLSKQLNTEMNISYAGRYIFSGYRTDTPPVLIEDLDPSISYDITQEFNFDDLQNTFGYVKSTASDGNMFYEIREATTIRLPYKNATIDGETISYVDNSITPPTVTASGFSIKEMSLNVATNNPLDVSPYNPAVGEVYYIKETGELVLGSDVVSSIKTNKNLGIEINYTKAELKEGELNPEIYFKESIRNDGVTFTMDNQTIEYEFGLNTRFGINSLAKNTFTDKMYSDLMALSDFVERIDVWSNDKLEGITYNTRFPNPSGVGGISLTEEEAEAISALEASEAQRILHDRFSDIIEQIDNHEKVFSKEHANLGSKMSRLELISNRLLEEETTYKTLLSKNEDVNYMEALMEMNIAESIYQAAMQVGANIMQITLANYI